MRTYTGENRDIVGMEYAVLFNEETEFSLYGDNNMAYFTENMIAFELCELKACCAKSSAEGLDDLFWY